MEAQTTFIKYLVEKDCNILRQYEQSKYSKGL